MWIRTGVFTTADASTGASLSASMSMLVDNVGGVPVSGSSLPAVLVGGFVVTGSVGVAATCSVDGAAVGSESPAVDDEHPVDTNAIIASTPIERFMNPSWHRLPFGRSRSNMTP